MKIAAAMHVKKSGFRFDSLPIQLFLVCLEVFPVAARLLNTQMILFQLRVTKYGRDVREPSACPLCSRKLLRKRPDSTALRWRENVPAGADSYLPANDRIPAWNFRPRCAPKK